MRVDTSAFVFTGLIETRFGQCIGFDVNLSGNNDGGVLEMRLPTTDPKLIPIKLSRVTVGIVGIPCKRSSTSVPYFLKIPKQTE
jgi:hypothetical protein